MAHPGSVSSGISVAQVRRVLSVLRARWSAVETGEGTARHLCSPVPIDATRSVDPEAFALEFLLAQHSKKSARTSDGGMQRD